MDIYCFSGREFRQQAYMASGHCSCLSVFILNKVTAGVAVNGENPFLESYGYNNGRGGGGTFYKFKVPVKFSPYNLVNKELK